MKYEEINRKFTEIVACYLEHGYHINTATMGPNGGEAAHIDLTNGCAVVRVMLNSFYCDGDFYNDGYEIVVGSASAVTPDAFPNCFSTIWNQQLHITERYKFFLICKRCGRHAWFGNRDEAVAAYNVRVDRNARRYEPVSKDSLPPYSTKIAERFIRRTTGIKHPNLAKINVRHAIRREDGRVYGQYIITYNGKAYILK